MRQYLFQSVVDAIALVVSLLLARVVALVLGDVQSVLVTPSDQTLVVSVLLFSITITAVHWFVRPLLVIFFGGWVMRSFGFFALILDVFLFWIALVLAPVQLQLASTPWWGVPVAAVLFNFVDFVVAALVGLNRPRLERSRAHAAVWRRLERLPSVRRNWINERLRLEEAWTTFLSFGLEIGLTDTPVGSLRRWCTRVVYGGPSAIDEMSTPALIRVMLEQLGPTYIKFGQMASSQAQTLPEEWVTELARLQSDVPPVAYDQARDVIVGELGQAPEALFADFDREAFAAASTAQVHRARLHDGTVVAVKVQRPNIVATVKADLGVLQDFSNLVSNFSSYARALDISGMLAEFGDGVVRELDYHNEAYHALRLAESMQTLPCVRVPAVYPELSGTRVLTMEFIEGVQVNKPGALDHPGIDPAALTEAFMRALIKQIFVDGFFHGDPHPGNIFLDLKAGAVAYLDFGLVGRLDQSKRLDLIDLVYSFQQRDAPSLANVALRVSRKSRPVNVGKFREGMSEMVNQYVRYATHARFDTMVAQFVALLQRYGLRLDSQFMLAMKAVVQSEAVVATLGGHMDFVGFAIQEIKTLTLAEFTRDKILETVTTQVTQVGRELVRRVPNLQDAAVSWVDQVLMGKLVVHVDTQDLTQHIDSLSATFIKLTAGLIFTGMIIGSAVVTSQIWQFSGEQKTLPYLAMIVFVVLLFVGARLIWGLLHPPRQPYLE